MTGALLLSLFFLLCDSEREPTESGRDVGRVEPAAAPAAALAAERRRTCDRAAGGARLAGALPPGSRLK